MILECCWVSRPYTTISKLHSVYFRIQLFIWKREYTWYWNGNATECSNETFQQKKNPWIQSPLFVEVIYLHFYLSQSLYTLIMGLADNLGFTFFNLNIATAGYNLYCKKKIHAFHLVVIKVAGLCTLAVFSYDLSVLFHKLCVFRSRFSTRTAPLCYAPSPCQN